MGTLSVKVKSIHQDIMKLEQKQDTMLVLDGIMDKGNKLDYEVKEVNVNKEREEVKKEEEKEDNAEKGDVDDEKEENGEEYTQENVKRSRESSFKKMVPARPRRKKKK